MSFPFLRVAHLIGAIALQRTCKFPLQAQAMLLDVFEPEVVHQVINLDFRFARNEALSLAFAEKFPDVKTGKNYDSFIDVALHFVRPPFISLLVVCSPEVGVIFVELPEDSDVYSSVFAAIWFKIEHDVSVFAVHQGENCQNKDDDFS